MFKQTKKLREMRKMSLVTLQKRQVTTQIFSQRVYRARRFRRGQRPDPCMTCYRWMAKQMMRRGLSTNGHVPIWCWSQDVSDGPVPTYTTARALLSDLEILSGIRVISLRVPMNQCLMTNYGWWNDVVDAVMSGGHPPPILPRKSIRPRGRILDQSENSAQVCIPFIAREWLSGARPLQQSVAAQTASMRFRRLHAS